MKNKGKSLTTISFAFLIFAIYGSIIILVILDRLEWLDKPIIEFIISFENQLLTEIMKFFTIMGSSGIITLIAFVAALALYFLLGHRKELVFFLVTLLGSTIINNTLKLIFQRERPSTQRLVEAIGYSFPSGHSMAAFTLYVTLTFLIWSHLKTAMGRILIIIFSAIMILMIGISRVYLGVHYPSDIIGGYFTSGIWVFFTISLFRKYTNK